MEVKAPGDYTKQPRPWVFLAGSIEMGMAENWQERIARLLPNITILNPRRDDWDNSWKQSINDARFREQVQWELQAQEDADLVLFHFDPNTQSPITLLELGLFKHKAIVHCPQGFWKKGNIDIVCQRYRVPQVASLDELISAVQRWAVGFSPPFNNFIIASHRNREVRLRKSGSSRLEGQKDG